MLLPRVWNPRSERDIPSPRCRGEGKGRGNTLESRNYARSVDAWSVRVS